MINTFKGVLKSSLSVSQASEENGHRDDFCSAGVWISHAGGGERCGTYEQQLEIFMLLEEKINSHHN